VRNDDETFRQVGTLGPDIGSYLENVSERLADRQFFGDSDWQLQTITIV
jgi:hypothetical protein